MVADSESLRPLKLWFDGFVDDTPVVPVESQCTTSTESASATFAGPESIMAEEFTVVAGAEEMEKEPVSAPAEGMPNVFADSVADLESRVVDTTMTIEHGASSSTFSGKPRDERFYFNFTTFEVEGTLFRVPRHPFETESPIFKDMFGMPSDSLADGSSDEKPLILPGISAKDFRVFLKVLFDPAHAPQNDLSIDEWTSLLRPSHMWCCDRLLALAISKLDTQITDPFSKIALAREYGIKDWILSLYFKFVTRTEPLTLEETNKLGVECAVKLNEVRESRYRWIIDDLEEARSNPHNYSPYSSRKKRRKKNMRARSPIDFRNVRRDVELIDDDVRTAITRTFGLG
ncbi:hypothetical protein ACEPAG_5462 [Sanghuangporus baumii]